MADALDTLALALRPYYARFLRPGTVLMTGHSHQAWPEVSRAAQLEAWDDAAELADHKWDRIFGTIIPGLQRAIARRLGSDRPDDLALAPNTHDLVYRLISCFPRDAPLLTTDQEFHSLRRQLLRLEEDGRVITRVPVPLEPGAEAELAERFIAALHAHRPALALLSQVFFTTGALVLELPRILAAAAELGVVVLVDAYHSFNVVPIDVSTWPVTPWFLVGGGYKYAQSGEGVCWMLAPRDAERFRPRHTGWFASFASLARPEPRVDYGPGYQRFLGATFDPTALYRGLRVLEWMDQVGLDPAALRAQSMRQTALLLDLHAEHGLARHGLTVASPRDPERRAGFVSFRHPEAQALVAKLDEAGVRTDARLDFLRLGPAPYTTRNELVRAMDALARALAR